MAMTTGRIFRGFFLFDFARVFFAPGFPRLFRSLCCRRVTCALSWYYRMSKEAGIPFWYSTFLLVDMNPRTSPSEIVGECAAIGVILAFICVHGSVEPFSCGAHYGWISKGVAYSDGQNEISRCRFAGKEKRSDHLLVMKMLCIRLVLRATGFPRILAGLELGTELGTGNFGLVHTHTHTHTHTNQWIFHDTQYVETSINSSVLFEMQLHEQNWDTKTKVRKVTPGYSVSILGWGLRNSQQRGLLFACIQC